MKALIVTAIVGLLMSIAPSAHANSGVTICISRVLDLFLVDLPEETQFIGFWVSDGFECPSEGLT